MKKAKKQEPEIDAIVKNRYEELISYETAKCDSIDRIADPFACMMSDIVQEIMGNKYVDSVKELAYNLGKWIYLIDALDDFDKDIKNKDYNVFACAYPLVKDKKELVEQNAKEIVIVLSSVLSRIGELAQQLDYKFNHDLLDNILLRGLSFHTKQIMENKKCKSTTKF